MATGTVRLHRVLKAKPERVYKAFLDADAMAKWLPPHGFTCKVHHLDAKVGGTFKMSFTNFTTGNGNSFGGEYLELVPNQRLRYTDIPNVCEETLARMDVTPLDDLSAVIECDAMARQLARECAKRLTNRSTMQ